MEVVTTYCRACLKISDVSVDMFQLKYEDTFLSELFRICTSVQLDVNSALTTYICKTCINELVATYTFIKKCQSADLKLKTQHVLMIPNNSLIQLQENVGDKLECSVVNVKSEPSEIETTIGGVFSCIEEIEADSREIEDIKPNISCVDEVNFETTNGCSEELNTSTTCLEEPVPCLECDIKFFSYLELSQHMREHNRYACEFCNKSFRQELVLKKHYVSHNSVKPYICTICNKSFNQIFYLNYHMRVHTQTAQYVCSDCGKTFKWFSTYKYHSCSNENSSRIAQFPRIFGCKICDKSFIQRIHWITHQRTHTGHRPYKCKLCGKSFMYLNTIRNHMRREHKIEYLKINVEYIRDKCLTDEDIHMLKLKAIETKNTAVKPYTCDICDKAFTQRAHWYTHQRIHTGHCPYRCKLCKNSYRHLNTFKSHMRKDHQQEFSRENLEFIKFPKLERKVGVKNVKPCKKSVVKESSFQCEICSEIKMKSSMRQHMMLHTGERRHYCEICGKGFIQKTSFREHMKKHTGETPYVCEHCNKGFRAQTSYKEHLTIHSPTENSVPCETCGKVLRSTQAWKRHQLIHNKRFLCNECGKFFTNKTQLTEHNNVHKGIRPYSCNICTKRFFQKKKLQVHIMRHENIKPHQCENCDKAFVTKCKLSAHIRKHHSDNKKEENHDKISL